MDAWSAKSGLYGRCDMTVQLNLAVSCVVTKLVWCLLLQAKVGILLWLYPGNSGFQLSHCHLVACWTWQFLDAAEHPNEPHSGYPRRTCTALCLQRALCWISFLMENWHIAIHWTVFWFLNHCDATMSHLRWQWSSENCHLQLNIGQKVLFQFNDFIVL